MKKAILLMAALSLATLQACNEEDTLPANTMDSGTCGAEGNGSNLTWFLANGTLTISGEGRMADYEDEHDTPFYGKRGSIRTIVIEKGVTSIGDYAFYGCTGLTSVILPESVASIGYYALYSCTGLTSITIPEGVTSIRYYAFCHCTGLKSVTIPRSITSIRQGTFYLCTGLKEIRVKEAVPPDFDYHDIYQPFSGINPSIPVYVPAGCIEAYRNSAWGQYFSNFLPLP